MLVKSIRHRESYLIVITMIVWVIISFLNPNFGIPSYMLELIGFNSIYFLTALGILPLMIMGNFDLSVGGIITAVSLLLLMLMSIWKLPVFVILFLGLLLGLAFGAFNGLMISKWKVSSAIVTLAMMSVYYGVTKYIYRITVNRKTIFRPEIMSVLGIEMLLIAFMVVLTYYILRYHPIGRSILAFGGNKDQAVKKGYKLLPSTVFVHGYCGMSAGLGAAVHLLTFQQASIDAYAGIEFELIIIVIIGGLRILGGYGTVHGTFVSCLFMVILKSGLVFARIPVFWHYMIIGTMIILLVSYDMFLYRMNIRKFSVQGE